MSFDPSNIRRREKAVSASLQKERLAVIVRGIFPQPFPQPARCLAQARCRLVDRDEGAHVEPDMNWCGRVVLDPDNEA